MRISGFMLDMPRLFEDFVLKALGGALTAHGGLAKAQNRWHLDVGRQVAIQPDLLPRRRASWCGYPATEHERGTRGP